LKLSLYFAAPAIFFLAIILYFTRNFSWPIRRDALIVTSPIIGTALIIAIGLQTPMGEAARVFLARSFGFR
jgi:hypothetical protein